MPEELRCRWTKREGERGVYDCPQCGCWTANLPLYNKEGDVCPQKERRKATKERRAR